MSARCVSISCLKSSSRRRRRNTFKMRVIKDIVVTSLRLERRLSASRCLLRESQRPADSGRELGPASLFILELPAAGRRNRVEAGFPPGLGLPPLCPQPFLVRHALQRRIERALFDA